MARQTCLTWLVVVDGRLLTDQHALPESAGQQPPAVLLGLLVYAVFFSMLQSGGGVGLSGQKSSLLSWRPAASRRRVGTWLWFRRQRIRSSLSRGSGGVPHCCSPSLTWEEPPDAALLQYLPPAPLSNVCTAGMAVNELPTAP
jgi:hypothetical protein